MIVRTLPGLLAVLAVLAVAVGCPTDEADDTPIGELHLIPVPVEISGEVGYLPLSPDSRIVAEADLVGEAELLAEVLRASTGYPFERVDEEPLAGDLVLMIDPSLATLGDEGYRIQVQEDWAVVSAPHPTGVYYGSQTLRQLLPATVESPDVVPDVDWALPRVVIEDQPRFAWRGMMLDVARHFFTPDEVMGLIDVAAHYKMNRFHLHLTDDQGWRIEIESWPDLAIVGGATEVGGGEGGYYTQAEYASIVEYAAARHVILVPEIDMPGHCNAALASYGELNESGEPAEPFTGTGVGFSALWLDGEITLPFVEDVLGEVAAMTPGPYLHIGGDEAFEVEESQYATFIAQVQEIVTGADKTLVGWEEIGRADLGTPVLAQAWYDPEVSALAADQGAAIIASPAEHAYLDMIYDLNSHVGTLWAGPTNVEDGYSWDPVSGDLNEEQVAGLEAPLWTETVDLLDDVEYLTFPRLLGHAEIGWSAAADRDWEDYRDRLAAHGPRMALRGLEFYPSDEVNWASLDD